MASKEQVGPWHVAAGICMLAVAVNQFSFVFFKYPVVYCTVWPYTIDLYLTLGSMVICAAAAYAVLQLFRGQTIHVIGGAAIIFGIVELPAFLTNVLGHGGACG